MNRESGSKNFNQRQQEQLSGHTERVMKELADLVLEINSGAMALRQRDTERNLGLAPHIDAVEGPTHRMMVIIEGWSKANNR